MSDKKYTPVEIELDDAVDLPDVHLEVLGVKLDLPNLGSSKLPIEIVQAVLVARSQPVADENTQAQMMNACLAYFQALRPDFWTKLRLSSAPMDYLVATIKAWGDQSGVDPKLKS